MIILPRTYATVPIKLHDSFKEGEKPQWLTMDKILEYKKEMNK